jgi:hypothetical protein
MFGVLFKFHGLRVFRLPFGQSVGSEVEINYYARY